MVHAACAAVLFSGLALPEQGWAQADVYWRDVATSGWWAAGDSDENRWYRASDGWDVRREDLANGQWSSSGTKAYVIVHFDNNNQPTMTVNAQGGTQHSIHQILFENSTGRTFARDGGAFLRMEGGSGNAKIEATSPNGTGTYTFDVPLFLGKQTELNPVSGNLTFNAAITNNGQRMLVYGGNTLTLAGVVSGTGGLSVLGSATVLLTGAHTFSGITTNQSGTLSVGNGSTAGALGASVVNNSTLRFNRSDAYSYTNVISGSGKLVKQGAGTLTLTGNNSYTGVTEIEGGNVTVGTGGALGNGSDVYISSGASATFNVNTSVGSLRERGLLDSGTASVGSGAVLTITGANKGTHYMNTISGAGGLTMSGSGTTLMRLFGANTYSGNTVINSASLGLWGTGSIANSPRIFIGTNATFDVSGRTAAYTLASGQGITVLASASANPATILMASTTGTLSMASSGSIVLGSFNNANGAPLTVSGSGSFSLASGNSVIVTNIGSALSAGSYKLISKTGSASVAGTAPSTVTVAGNGLSAAHSASLTITSGELFLTVTQDPPGVPTSVAASDGTSTAHVTVTWTAASGATSHEVYRNTANNTTTGSNLGTQTSPFNDTTATPGQQYYYFVRGENTGGYGNWSTSDTGYRALAAPSNVAASDGSSTAHVTVTWDAVTGATSYRVYRNTVNNSGTAQDLGVQSSAFNDTTSTNGVLYYYWVRAEASSSSSQSTFSSSDTGYRALTAPANVAASDGTSSAHVTVTWDSVTGATSYRVYRNTVNNSGTAQDLGVQTSAFNDTTSTNGVLYYYWVRAEASSSSSQSAFSSSDTGYRAVAAPANVAASDGTSTAHVTVTWDAATGADSYKVYRNTANNFGAAQDLGTQSSPFNDATSTNGVLYYYWVTAVDSSPSHESAPGGPDTGYRKLATVGSVTASVDTFDDKVRVQWADITGETGYSIWRNTSDNSGAAAWVGSVAANATLFDDVPPLDSTDYYYWVRGTNSTSASQGDFQASGTLGRMAAAVIGVWIGDGANGNWGTADNWSSSTVPGASDDASFYTGLDSGASINLESTYSINSVTFLSDATTALSFSNNALTIAAGGMEVESGSGAHTFANNIVLGAGQTWENASSSTLTVSGNVSGSAALTKTGSGRLTLSGNNSFTGNLNVDVGYVRLQGNANAQGAGTTVVATGTTLELNQNLTYPRPITLNGLGVGNTAAIDAQTASTLSGAITLGSDARVRAEGSGIFNMSGGIAAGTYTLYVTNTARDVRMTGGDFSGSKTTGDGTIRKTGTSALRLRPGSGLTGTIYLDQGTIEHSVGNSSVLPSGGLLVLADGTTYRSDGTTARTVAKAMRMDGNVTIGHTGGTGALTLSGNVDLNSGTRTLTVPNDNIISGIISDGGLTKAGAGQLTLSGNNTYADGTTISAGSLRIGAGGTSGSVSGHIANNAALLFDRSDSLTYNGTISGSGTLAKQSAGILTLGGNNTFEGVATISAGAIRVTHANGLGTTDGNTTVSSGAALELSNHMMTVPENLVLNGTGISSAGALVNLANQNTVSGTIELGSAASIGVTDILNLSGVISGANTLTKVGTGRLSISSTSTYSGDTTVSAGTLLISGSIDNSDVTVAAGASLWGAGSMGDVTVSGTVDPGDTAGARATLSAGVLNLENNGQMTVDFSAMTGAAGTDWDRISASGVITVNATSANPFVIKLQGNPTFDGTTSYTNIIMAGASVSGFAANKFSVDTDDFDPALAGGAFSVQQVGNNIALVFAPRLLWFPFTGDLPGASNVYANLTVGDMQNISAYGTTDSGGWTGPSGTPYAQGNSGWDAVSQAAAKNFSFTITADADYIFYVTGARILWRRTSVGPTDVGFTLDGTSAYATTLADSVTVTEDVLITGYDAMTNTTFRIDGWGGGAGQFRIDDVELFGRVEQGPVITVTGSLADFGLVGVGSASSELTYTVSGVRLRDDLTITAPTGFEISLTSGSGFTSSLNLTPSGGTVGATTIYVRFAPGTTGAFSADIVHASPLAVTKLQAVTGEGISGEPSTQAHTVNFSAIGKDTLTVNWTSGNGDNRVVLAKEGAAVNANPADGNDYTAHAEFAVGDQIGTGNYVVYNGAGSSVAVTGLKTNTTYHFRVYEFNGSGGTENYNTNTASGNPASESTLDNDPGIGFGATTLNVSSTLGSAPSASSFGVTNVGGGTLIYTIATNASWLTVSPVGASLTEGNAQQHSVTYQSQAGMQPGVSNAVITITDAGATNSPQTIDVEWTINAIPNPSVATVSGEGSEYIELAWTKHASYNVMIVHRQGAAVGALSQGTAYSVGGAAGGGTVIYKGAGSSLEHIISAGATHHYAFFSYSGNYYSSGLTGSAAMPAYASGISVEVFAYTNTGTLATSGQGNGGTGWDGSWYGDTSSFSISGGSFASQSNYPATAANKVLVTPPSDTSRSVFRPLDETYMDGQIYVGFIVNYQYDGANKFAGLSLYWSNTAEKVFFGEIYDANKTLGIGGSSSSYTLDNGTGNDYIVIGKYDWAAGEASVKAYKVGTQTVPITEPGAWDLTVSIASNTVGFVNSIRLSAGAGASSGTPGDVYFDEVRVASSWSDLLGVVPDNPDDPGSASATADGVEMVRLAWTKNGDSDDVLILNKGTAITTDPTDSISYNVGNTIDGATVIYKGSGTSLEHIVPVGSTNYYTFYSVAANYYSDGLDDDLIMGVYATAEVVNPFAYTNSTQLGTTTVGGQGFGANFWATGGSGTWTVHQNPASASGGAPRFVDSDNYNEMAGNVVRLTGLADGQDGYAERTLSSSYSTGVVYVAYMMSYQYYGSNKWAGVSLFDGAAERAFFGKGFGNNWHTLGVGDGTTTWFSSTDLLPTDGGGNTGNVYIVVGRYDFENDRLQASAWRQLANDFPEDEPASWQVTQDTVSFASFDRVRIQAGAGSASDGTIGSAQFDELRIAREWSELIPGACPSWIGSNLISSTSVYLGDSINFEVQTWPIGAGQFARVELDWDDDASFQTHHLMDWVQQANNNSYWSNRVQMTQTVAALPFRYAASAVGGGCSPIYTNSGQTIEIVALPDPSTLTAVTDTVFSNSQINVGWAPNAIPHDVMVLRRTSNAGWPTPTPGVVYFANDTIGDGTVIYRGSATNVNDTGLAPNTAYYYRLYSENWGYYSGGTNISATTGEGVQVITVDGDPSDWVGSAGTVINSGTFSVNEFIWRDRPADARTDNTDYSNAELQEFRVFADVDDVYFLVKYDDITSDTLPYVAIGVDTRRNSSSTAMNWIGDDANTLVGGQYFGSGAAERYPEHNIIVHKVGAEVRVELFNHTGGSWYAPVAYDAAISDADNAMEFRIPRSDLNLTGSVTGRVTVATFLNTGAWANEGNSTVNMPSAPDALDSISIAPYNVNDGALALSAWGDDLSDGDIDFWFDLRFGAGGLAGNTVPSTPGSLSPAHNANVGASPTLSWASSTDSDGEVTSYFLEVSTNEFMNGVTGTENGNIFLRVNLPASQTSYALSTSEAEYFWRVRARDTGGALSGGAINRFTIGGATDVEGPLPTLLYIGTDVDGFLDGDYDSYIGQFGLIQDVLDSEIAQGDQFGFVLQWTDPSGVYATNKTYSGSPSGSAQFTYNIVSTDGRVSPNWDIIEYQYDDLGNLTNTYEWGIDVAFPASNTWAQGNTDTAITNYVHAAFSITNYNPLTEYFLTVSAEDGHTGGGSWWSSGSWNSHGDPAAPYWGGYAEDGPNTVRNITTNYLIRIQVRDDDVEPPLVGRYNAGWGSLPMIASNTTAGLLDSTGDGQAAIHEISDGDLAASNDLTLLFNVWDRQMGIQRGATATTNVLDNVLTNTRVTIEGWLTNNTSFYRSELSDASTTHSNSYSTWVFSPLYDDIGDLWGPDPSAAVSATNRVWLQLYDSDNDRAGDQSDQIATMGFIQLYDDDTDPPELVNMNLPQAAENRAFFVLTNGVAPLDLIRSTGRRSGSGADTIHRVTDAELANSGSANIQFAFGALDVYSGISRGTTGGTNDVMSFSLGDVIEGNFANWDVTLSTTETTTNQVLTNVWTFADGFFDGDTINDLMTGVQTVRVTIPDADNDRPGDRSVLLSEQVGRIEVLDDDVYTPMMGALDLDISSTHNLLVMGFEVYHGWTNASSATYGGWQVNIGADEWLGNDINAGSLTGDTIMPSNVRVVGMRNNLGEDAWLQMPEREDPGTVFVWARLSSAGDRTVRLEGTTNGMDWVSFGDQSVDATTWRLLHWSVQERGAWTLRVRRITGDGTPTVWLDDLVLTKRLAWTNVLEMDVTFDAGSDDSGIHQYRAITNATPVWQNGTNVLDGFALATNEATIALSEGIVTGFVFAVDNDNDRPGDRLRNPGIPYVVRIDRTPPLAVDNVRATDASGANVFDETIDETSEIKVEWAPPAGTEAESAGWRQSDSEALSPWDTFVITYHEVEDDTGTTSPPGAVTNVITRETTGWTNVLNNWAFTNLVLTDLSFDSYYHILIQGRDEAGNLGPTTNVIGNTDRFIVTQGLARTSTRSEIFWTAATNSAGEVTREYDLVYANHTSYGDHMQQQWRWNLAGSVYSNWYFDEDVITNNAMRFFRASPKGRWDSERPVASEEVYVARPVRLHRPSDARGKNWVAFPGIPDTSTVVRIFGTDLPAAPLAFSDGTVLTWFDRATGSIATQQVYLAQGTPNEWFYRLPPNRESDPANDVIVPLDQGVVVEIPAISTLTNYTFLFVGRVPTNEIVQTIEGKGVNGWANNLVSVRLPRSMHPSEMGLLDAGFTGSANPNQSDLIVKWNRMQQRPAEAVYYNTSGDPDYGGWRFFTDEYPGSSVPAGFFGPDDGLLIVTKGSVDSWVWTNTVPYAPPSRFLDP